LSEEKTSHASTAPTTTVNISALLICIIINIYVGKTKTPISIKKCPFNR